MDVNVEKTRRQNCIPKIDEPQVESNRFLSKR